jgi:glycosyltransferase involved in cell wall biosynthesis
LEVFKKIQKGKTNLPKLSKGPDIFINIVKDMYEKNNKIEIVLTGLRREYLINELEKCGIKYHYFNMVSLKEINELFNCLNLYIISSRCEGGPRAVLEAGLTKTPIISTKVGIAPELMARSSLYDYEDWITYINKKPNVELLYNNVIKLTKNEYMEEFRDYLLN